MKEKIFAVVVFTAIILLGTQAFKYADSQSIITVAKEVTTVEVTVSETEKAIEEAKEEALAEIEVEAQEAYNKVFDLRMAEVENQVLSDIQETLEQRKASNTKKVSDY